MRFANRREFLARTSFAAAGLVGCRASAAAEPPPEVTTVRFARWPLTCTAPASIAEALLRAEGFTEVRYLPPEHLNSVARGDIDFDVETAPWLVAQADAGEPIQVLAGLHVGCYELFAHEPIRTIGDLRGRRVGIDYLGSGGHMYLSIMLAQVGLDPRQDVEWVTAPYGDQMEPFVAREVDAFLGFPPEPQELRNRDIGRVILNTVLDTPWSHYFCCMLYGNAAFVRDHPVATKRVVRAILKAADLCASQPELAARELVDGGFVDDYDLALQTLSDLPFDRWREYDHADTLRFFALRLHEVGMVEASPNRIIENGADWRFLDELKQELKA